MVAADHKKRRRDAGATQLPGARRLRYTTPLRGERHEPHRLGLAQVSRTTGPISCQMPWDVANARILKRRGSMIRTSTRSRLRAISSLSVCRSLLLPGTRPHVNLPEQSRLRNHARRSGWRRLAVITAGTVGMNLEDEADPVVTTLTNLRACKKLSSRFWARPAAAAFRCAECAPIFSLRNWSAETRMARAIERLNAIARRRAVAVCPGVKDRNAICQIGGEFPDR